MIEPLRVTEEPPPPRPVTAPELAAQLAGKLCHDFISPASAITSGLDLLEDPTAQDMREEAIGLITSSARKLVALLAFDRVAFGTSAMAESFDVRELETLTRGVYDHMRAELEWAVEPAALNKPAARALLNMAQIAGGALPTGGTARIAVRDEGGEVVIETESRAPRARLKPEVQTGLQGLPLSEGLSGQWVQSYYLSTLVEAAGGSLEYEAVEELVRIRARIPA
ncbi:MAG TPA: histidine phosphotransferase family protein [Caulobacteraceae bacterium]|jgi:histidine phosphotransferase ChpT